MRAELLRDQLEIYARHGASWAIWTYKDIGLQGVVYAAPDSPWVERIRPIIEKKARLGVDAWGGTDAKIRHVMEPLERLFAEEYPHHDPFPFGTQREIELLVRNILLAEPMLKEYGELFRGMNEEQIDEMMRSFRFENCVRARGARLHPRRASRAERLAGLTRSGGKHGKHVPAPRAATFGPHQRKPRPEERTTQWTSRRTFCGVRRRRPTRSRGP
jgi:hypothetical protein